jgi:hypothetical protein
MTCQSCGKHGPDVAALCRLCQALAFVAYRAWLAAALDRDRREKRGPVLVQPAP